MVTEERIKFLAELPLGYFFVKEGSSQVTAIEALAEGARGKSLSIEKIEKLKEEAIGERNAKRGGHCFSPGQDGYGAIEQLVELAKVNARRTLEVGEKIRRSPGAPEYPVARAEAVDCVTSLHQAIQQAGGTVSERYLDMTVREFISTVAAQNHIYFVYKRPD